MKVLLYHATGNQNVRATLRALASGNMLHSFHTTIAVFASRWYYRFLNGKLSMLRRRTYPESARRLVCTYPFLEAMMFLGVRKFFGQRLTPPYIDKVLSRKLAGKIRSCHNVPDMLYCYPGHAEMIMHAAAERNVKCVYELTTAYYKHVLELYKQEEVQNKEWYDTITFYREEGVDNAKYDAELNVADHILCASSYIKRSLLEYGFPEEKITILPYGFPEVRPKSYSKNTECLNLLFVGNLAQSKGLSYMFDAVDSLGHRANLTLVGTLPDNNSEFVQDRIKSYNYLGAQPHERVLEEMHKADILLFPTLTDGFGMVVSEAMSQGTPVIATCNSCAADIIVNGENGWVIPVQDSGAIKIVLNDILAHPEMIKRIGEKALETARLRPWSRYEEDLRSCLNTLR